MSLNLKMSRRHTSIIGPGDYFGGIFSNMTQIQKCSSQVNTLIQTYLINNLREIIKVAILPQECFLQFKEAYPDWFLLYHQV